MNLFDNYTFSLLMAELKVKLMIWEDINFYKNDFSLAFVD